MGPKVATLADLARYKVGDILYQVALRPIGLACVQYDQKDAWIADAHPKVLFDRGYINKAWKFKAKPPKLGAADFHYVTSLLTSEPVVERFQIVAIHRSPDTGEFYYQNLEQEWMPESYLLPTEAAGVREKFRIKDLFQKWAGRHSPDKV